MLRSGAISIPPCRYRHAEDRRRARLHPLGCRAGGWPSSWRAGTRSRGTRCLGIRTTARRGRRWPSGRIAVSGVVEVSVFQGCRATRVLDVPTVKLFSQTGDSGLRAGEYTRKHRLTRQGRPKAHRIALRSRIVRLRHNRLRDERRPCTATRTPAPDRGARARARDPCGIALGADRRLHGRRGGRRTADRQPRPARRRRSHALRRPLARDRPARDLASPSDRRPRSAASATSGPRSSPRSSTACS